MELSHIISSDLNVPSTMIEEALSYGHEKIKKIHIKKRSGGTRTIQLPYSKVKTVQYWLIYNVFSKLPVHPCAMAYRKGLSILDNAKRHKDNKYFLKLDFKDFFPCIKLTDLIPIVSSWHSLNKIQWDLTPDSLQIFKICCFDPKGRLPIGYPSSPSISNVVMYDFDVSVTKAISNKDTLGNVIYTRYADDLIFSTNKPNVCNKIFKIVDKVIKTNLSPKLLINSDKTAYASSSGGTAQVTGLRLCTDGHITVHHKYKDHIRLLLSLFQKNGLDPSEYESLRGHLSYIKHVEPAFYTKIQNKYFHAIEKLYS